jgi:hypothetical protein
MTSPRRATSSRGSRPSGRRTLNLPFALWPPQCRARLADAVGDAAGYAETVIRYRNLAEQLDARGHLAVAKQLATEPAFRSRA